MPFLAAATASTQPDYIALAIVVVLFVIVAVMALRKRFGTAKKAQPKLPEAEPVAQTPKATAPGTAGNLKLHDVEPKTAAMVMAIVADKLGKPLNELRFISIKEVK